MKKIIKGFIACLMCLTIALSNYMVSYASENDNNLNPSYSNIELYVCKIPDIGWNIAKEGTYRISGSADYSTLYTNYYFTGVNSLDIKINNKGDKNVTVTVYKMVSGLDLVRSVVIIGSGKTKTWNVGTKKDANYYISFSAPCTITGTVSNGG